MHHKVNVMSSLVYMPKKVVSKFDHSLVFIFSFPNNIIIYILLKKILCDGPMPFFYHSTSFASPTGKSRWTMLVDNVGLKTCLLGASNFMVTLTFFLGVN
jgi:hypothetical protein